MKSIYQKKLLFLIFSFVSIFQLTAQTTVTYDFKKNEGLGVIPFDEFIRFDFKNLPPYVNTLVFTCYEYKNGNVNSKNEKLNKILFFADTASKYKGLNTEDSTAYILSNRFFKPNKTYLFEIQLLSKEKPLSKNQKERIMKELLSKKVVSNELTKLNITLSESDFTKYSKNVMFSDSLIKRLIDSTAEEVLDKKVEFTKNSREQILLLSDVTDRIQSLYDQLKRKDTQSYKDLLSKDTSNRISMHLIDLERKLKGITFFPIDKKAIGALKGSMEKVQQDTNYIKTKLLDKSLINAAEYTTLQQYLQSLEMNYSKLIKAMAKFEENFSEKFLIGSLLDQMQLYNMSSATYPEGLVEQSKNYFAADIGWAYVPAWNDFTTFTQASVYFRPVKREVPLNHYRFWSWDNAGARLSLDIGMSLNSVVVENERKGFAFDPDKDPSNALMLGVGIRVLTFAKINIGSIIYQVENANPLVQKYDYTSSLYLGASIDLSLQGLWKENFSKSKSTSTSNQTEKQ